MKEKMNIVSPRNSKDGQTIWHTIGTAFKNEKTGGWDLLFNSLPLPEMNDRGQSILMIRDHQYQRIFPCFSVIFCDFS